MINKDYLDKLISEHLKEECFIVDVSLSADNKIKVLIDSKAGVSISDCIQLSRNIEHNIDREEEDFALEVSSPGLDAPFKVLQQYEKNINREIEVITKSGEKIIGKLIRISKDEIDLEEKKKIKIEGKKKKQEVINNRTISFNNIKSSIVLISFK